MAIQTKKIAIPSANGETISAIKFFSHLNIHQTVVISSATGVLQKYYDKFSSYLALQGFTVYTFDYCGIGGSTDSLKALKENQTDLRSWGSNDQAAVVAFAKSENIASNLTLIAHSIGGQLLGFNPQFKLIDKIIMVASQSGYWKYFKGIHLFKMWLLWYVIIPILTPLYGYFPSKKLGLFENLPKNMVYEWASWGRQAEYMMHFKNDECYYFDSYEIPILALSFDGDHFAPRKTVDWLSSQYRNAQLERVHHHDTDLEKEAKHFGFFKVAFKELFWDKTIQWILNTSYR